ncbi:MAG: AI-2E family transporter [Patescibacteria group bacterium]|nr:AI-2E family transporter [Patescibacteria group bacterium]
MDSNKLETWFFIFFLSLSVVALFFIYLPFLNAIILALTFLIIFWPVYASLLKFFRGFKFLSAIITIILVCVVVFVPLVVFGFQIFAEAKQIYISGLNSNGMAFGNAFADIQKNIQKFIPNFYFDFNGYTKGITAWIVQNIGVILSGLTSAFFTFFLSLFAFYYLLKDGGLLKQSLIKIIPLRQKEAEEIFNKLHLMAGSVIRGSLIMSIIQGVILGFGFFIFGIPQPVLWGAVGVIVALIPIVGTLIVAVPAAAYLLLLGHLFPAAGIILWTIIVGGGTDNLLRPNIIKRKANVHPFLILLSVLGGLVVYGPMGFLLGPLILSLLFALLSIYPVLILKREEINPPTFPQSAKPSRGKFS